MQIQSEVPTLKVWKLIIHMYEIKDNINGDILYIGTIKYL